MASQTLRLLESTWRHGQHAHRNLGGYRLLCEGSQLPILFKDQVDTKTAHTAGLTARLGVFVTWMLKTLKEIPGKKLCLQVW